MGIQINGQTDTVTSTTAGGKVTVTPASFPFVDNLNATGIVTASNFIGNVTGNVNATGLSTFSGGLLVGTGASISSPSSNALALGTNNTEVIRVGAAGSVGIATTSPQTKLHIHNAGWVNNTVGTGGLLLSSVDIIGPGIALRQKEGYYWNLYHGSTAASAAKGNFGFVWSDGINAASSLTAGITTAGYIVGNRNIIQVVDATTATRVNGAGSFTAITSSSIKCTTNKTRFMISVTCPVNTSDDSDAGNTASINPYFYGLVERNLNGAGWVTCGGRGSSSQGGYNAHIELSPNRTGNNGTSDYWSGNRYRMEHKYAHFFDDEISPGSNQTIQFRLRVIYQGGENWIQIGEPQGYGADDDYPCQRWGMMIYELGPDAPFTMVNTAP